MPKKNRMGHTNDITTRIFTPIAVSLIKEKFPEKINDEILRHLAIEAHHAARILMQNLYNGEGEESNG